MHDTYCSFFTAKRVCISELCLLKLTGTFSSDALNPHLTEEEIDPDVLEDHELDELAVKLNQELDDLEHGTDYEDYQADADADVDDNADANDALKGSY